MRTKSLQFCKALLEACKSWRKQKHIRCCTAFSQHFCNVLPRHHIVKHQIHEEAAQSRASHSHAQYIGNFFNFSFTNLFSHSCFTELYPLQCSNGKLPAQTTSLKWKTVFSTLACGRTWNPFLKSLTETLIYFCQILLCKLKDHTKGCLWIWLCRFTATGEL